MDNRSAPSNAGSHRVNMISRTFLAGQELIVPLPWIVSSFQLFVIVSVDCNRGPELGILVWLRSWDHESVQTFSFFAEVHQYREAQ
jgi:hypothetical protein